MDKLAKSKAFDYVKNKVKSMFHDNMVVKENFLVKRKKIETKSSLVKYAHTRKNLVVKVLIKHEILMNL